TVEDNYEDAEAPEATLLNVSKTVVAGEKTTFSVQAVDFVSDEADTIADANLKLVVEYKYDDGNWTSLLAKNGVYTIEVPKAQTGNITVKATATDDAGNSFTTPEKVIEIKNYTADDDTPTSTAFDFDSNWFESGSTFKTFVKGDEVKLPTVSFNDTTSDNLVVTAYVDHINSTTNRTTNIAIFNGLSGSSKTVSLGGETVKLPYSGSYVVTYIATDPAGNMQVSSFEFEAISNTAPTIAGLGNIEGTAEWGEEIDLVSPITVYNDTEIVDYNIVYVPNNITDADDYVKNTVANGSLVIKVEGSYIALPDNKIQAREGTITVSYWAKGDTGLCSEKQTKTITASDSKAPTIYVDESLLPDTHEFDADADNEAETTNWIYIPSIENVIDEGSGIDYSSLEVTAQYTSSSQKLEIKDIPADDAEHAGFYGYVVATKNGTINITYKITDNRGNESQATMLAVAVGDVTAPTISIDDVELKAAYKVGDTITINLSDVKVSDDSDVVDDPETTDEDESADNVKSGDVVVTLTCNGSTVAKSDSSASGSTYVFNIEKAGNYVVTYKITDAAGNTAT
ncbi:MAG: hypothetical protein IJW25_01840, partial [Clostridia bacterium]|nr:hypothetical protein [Clostridia bacterium]